MTSLNVPPCRRPVRVLAAALLAASLTSLVFDGRVHAQNPSQAPDVGNPTGNSGQFNGDVATAGSYDPLTGNATRAVTDLTVPGSVGQYPLAFSRTANSRFMSGIAAWFGDGGNWRHNFQYELKFQFNDRTSGVLVLHYPDGSRVLFAALAQNDNRYTAAQTKPPASLRYGQLGIRDRLDDADPNHPVLRLADGGLVAFESYTSAADGVPSYRPTQITDPHGSSTTLSYWTSDSNELYRATERGGRWLQLDYLPPYNGAPKVTVHSVTAWNGQQVIYSYGQVQPVPGSSGSPYVVLTGAQYTAEPSNANANAAVAATYDYAAVVAGGGTPVLAHCYDPHFAGAMWGILYAFSSDPSRWGQVSQELSPWSNEAVSSLNSGTANDEFGGQTRQETRGDSADGSPLQRSFGYWPGSNYLHYVTDFQGNRKVFQYDGFGYPATVNDWRNWQTVFTNEPHVGAVTRVTLPPDKNNATHSRTLTYGNDLYPTSSRRAPT